MARPNKEGLDYFPIDTNMDQDDKIALIEAKHGIVGFGVIIKLYKKIYSTYGYYYFWDEQRQLLFSKQAGVEINKVIEIVNDAIHWDLFDKTLFQKYKILTSKRIQKTYIEATKRRKEIPMLQKYILNGVNGYINKINAHIIFINDDKSTQTETEIETESKQKVNKIKYADFVYMTKEEYQKLFTQYGDKNTKAFIEKLSIWKGANGKTKPKGSDYLKILNWVVEAVLGKSENRKVSEPKSWQALRELKKEYDKEAINDSG